MSRAMGGPPSVVSGHASALADQGHSVSIYTLIREGESPILDEWAQLDRSDITIKAFQTDVKGPIASSAALATYLQTQTPSFDVVHFHGVWEKCLVQIADHARRHGLPYVISPHGMMDRYSMKRSRIKKLAALKLLGIERFWKNASALQFGTIDEKSEASPLGLKGKTFTIPNGVSDEFITREPVYDAKISTIFPKLADAEPLFIFFSRMHHKKGIDILLKAVTKTHKDYPNAKYLIAALPQDMQYEAEMRNYVSQNSLTDRVLITTEHTGMSGSKMLDLADVFVLPSRQEGFSMAIIEAMARGLPMLISDKCHMDVVSEYNAGIVASIGGDDFEGGLREVLEMSPEMRKAQGSRGRDWVASNCTWTKIAQQLTEMYKAVASMP